MANEKAVKEPRLKVIVIPQNDRDVLRVLVDRLDHRTADDENHVRSVNGLHPKTFTLTDI